MLYSILLLVWPLWKAVKFILLIREYFQYLINFILKNSNCDVLPFFLLFFSEANFCPWKFYLGWSFFLCLTQNWLSYLFAAYLIHAWIIWFLYIHKQMWDFVFAGFRLCDEHTSLLRKGFAFWHLCICKLQVAMLSVPVINSSQIVSWNSNFLKRELNWIIRLATNSLYLF